MDTAEGEPDYADPHRIGCDQLVVYFPAIWTVLRRPALKKARGVITFALKNNSMNATLLTSNVKSLVLVWGISICNVE